MDTLKQDAAEIAKTEAEAIKREIAEKIQARRKSNADMRKDEFVAEISILLRLVEHYTKIAQIMSDGGDDDGEEAPRANTADEGVRRRVATSRKPSRSIQKGV